MLRLLIAVCLCGSALSIQSWEINEHHDFKGTRFGDMMLTPQQLSRYFVNETTPIRGVARKQTSTNRWRGNVVPYFISPQYTTPQKEVLRRSLQDLEKMACFRFVERTAQKDYVFIVPLDGCYSYVGKIGGRQLLSLSEDCLADYIIWHEMMHAIGFEHEHQRPDRDQFIKVDYKNVIPSQMVNFEKIRTDEVDYPDIYDYKSIMHYDGYAFGKVDLKQRRRLATMIPLKSGVELIDNVQFSVTDIKKLRRLGNCDVSVNTLRKDAVVSCVDAGDDCSHFKSRGLCKDRRYAQLMQKFCPKSCDLCVRGSDAHESGVDELLASEEEAQDTTLPEMCIDERSNCHLFASQCDNPAYKSILMVHCTKTCGFCGQETNLCVDLDSNCSTFAKNGYCTNDFYNGDSLIRCRKTCGHC